jgi:hypothetical protein
MPTEKAEPERQPVKKDKDAKEAPAGEVSVEGVPYQQSGLYEEGEENPGPYPGGEGKNAPGYDDDAS